MYLADPPFSNASAAGLPGPLRDATALAERVRPLWGRSGPARRAFLRVWAKWWLARHAPAVVTVTQPFAAGRIVLNGPGYCARRLLLTGGYEPPFTRAFSALLRPGMTVFDVGANLGIYSLLAAAKVGPSRAVHAIEPAPEVFACLRESARLAGSHVTVNHAAVAEREGLLAFHLADHVKDSGLHSLAPSAARHRRVEVPGVTLDGYTAARNLAKVDLIKIDIEGAELLALHGAERLLSGPAPPMLMVEVSDCHAAAFRTTAADVKVWLRRRGYRGCTVMASGRWRRVPARAAHPTPLNVFFFRPEHREHFPPHWRLPEHWDD